MFANFRWNYAPDMKSGNDKSPLVPLAPMLTHASPQRMRNARERRFLAFAALSDVSDSTSPESSIIDTDAAASSLSATSSGNTYVISSASSVSVPALSLQSHLETQPLAALCARVTLALVTQYPPANTLSMTLLHLRLAPNGNQMLMRHHLAELNRFAASSLSHASLTPSSPFVVMHALLLVHRILTNAPSNPPVANTVKVTHASPSSQTPPQLQRSRSAPSTSITAVASVYSAGSTSSGSCSGASPPPTTIPISLHSPTRLLLAGLILADHYSSDHPLPMRIWSDLSGIGVVGTASRIDDASLHSTHVTDMKEGSGGVVQIKRDALEFLAFHVGVRKEEFSAWCSTVRKWASK
ncbi:hypothetical protein BC830DRAFT_1076976 [Chytriomyces sp. MP71]|nr:hypothetical protein BC830DRAFT_1076976 [Chytriomyces sp. MP71]